MKVQKFSKKSLTASKIFFVFNIIFLSLFILCAIYAGLMPNPNKFNLFESPIPIFIGSIALIGVLFWLSEHRLNSKFLMKYYKYIIIIFFVVSTFIQLLVAYALRSYGYTWDSAILFNQAELFANTGQIDPNVVKYFAVYPNNIALLSLLSSFFTILKTVGINDYLSGAILLNVIVMTFSQILTFLTVKLMYGRKIAALAMIFTFPLIILTMYVQIPYTDTLTIIFPILLLYLSIHYVRTNKLWLKFALALTVGIVAMFGYLIKPTVIIALIALLAIGFVLVINNIVKKKRIIALSLISFALCLFGIAGTYVTYATIVDRQHVVPFSVLNTSKTSVPIVHFLSMGMKTSYFDNRTEYGGYNSEQATAVTSIPTKAGKTEYSVNIIKQRLSEYGPVGYAGFLMHKANWILSDSTFHAYGEGSNEDVVFTNNDRLSVFIRSFMFIDGAWYILFGNILQIFWLAILLLIGSQLLIIILNENSRNNAYAVVPRVMIAGILVFLLLFEGRSRYIFLYIPIFIVAAMYTLQWFKTFDIMDEKDELLNDAKI